MSTQVQHPSHPNQDGPRISPKAGICLNPVIAEKQLISGITGEIEAEQCVRFPCRRKTCRACGPHLRKCHIAHFIRIFEDLPALKALSLTIDPATESKNGERVADLSRTEQRKYLYHVWKAFTDSLRRLCKKNGGQFVYLGVVEPHQDGRPHIHGVASLPLSGELIRAKWMKFGGGAQCRAKEITDEEGTEEGSGLKRLVAYLFKHHFDAMAYKTKHRTTYRSLYASQGIGYNSAKAKAERRRFARRQREQAEAAQMETAQTEAPAPLPEKLNSSKPVREVYSRTAFERWHRQALEGAVGDSVTFPGGEGMLVALPPGESACVKVEDVTIRVDPQDLLPSGVTPPHIIRYRMSEPGGMPSYFEDLEDMTERFRQLQRGYRRVSCILEDRNGRRVRWTYDRQTGQMRQRVVEKGKTGGP